MKLFCVANNEDRHAARFLRSEAAGAAFAPMQPRKPKTHVWARSLAMAAEHSPIFAERLFWSAMSRTAWQVFQQHHVRFLLAVGAFVSHGAMSEYADLFPSPRFIHLAAVGF